MSWHRLNQILSQYGWIPLILLIIGLLVEYGQLRGQQKDLEYVRTHMATSQQIDQLETKISGLSNKVESLITSTELIKAKINNEIIPRLNGDEKIKPLSGIPVEKEIIVGTTKYGWVIPYAARGGESAVEILQIAGVSYEPTKVKEVVAANPTSFKKLAVGFPAEQKLVAAPGAFVLIPVSHSYVQKYLAETLHFREGVRAQKLIPPLKEGTQEKPVRGTLEKGSGG